MLVSSPSANDSFPHPLHSFASLQFALYYECSVSKPSFFIFTTYNITMILLLLPLCIFILHHGLQQWRQRRSTSSAATVSHSDIFTYHMVVMELVGLVGCIVSCCIIYTKDLLSVGVLLLYFTWYGETLFHVLTCVERYLAVVHPITYLSLRNQRGIRIRNISITCVWLLCFVGSGLVMTKNSIYLRFSFSVVSLTVISFLSLSVLCVLIRPGPGEQGGGRKRVDQSKLRAFYTIMAILGVLVLRFAPNLCWYVVYMSVGGPGCVMMSFAFWFNLPSGLVLPLLFLHRAGRLRCWRKDN